MIELRGGPATVSIDPERGGEVASYWDDRVGANIFWSRFDASVSQESSGEINQNTQAFYDDYRGGMQELFPNTGDSTAVLGAELPFHGELCRTRCEVVEVSSSSVTLRGRLKRYPVVSTRTLSLADSGNFTVVSHMENLSRVDLPYSWGFHPVFSDYFTGPGSVLSCATTGAYSHPSPFSRSQVYPPGTPVTFTPDGAKDFLELVPPEGPSADLVYVQLRERWFTLQRPGSMAVTLRWDNPAFDSLWLWQECHSPDEWPWWGLHHIVGVEPHTSHPAVSLDEHISRGSHSVLPGRGVISATYEFELAPPGHTEAKGTQP